MKWRKQGTKLENSVLKLIVTQAIYDIERPYKQPNDEIQIGTGFIVDISKGIVVTNSKIVENALTIIGRLPKLGKRDIKLEFIGICREKELALCKIIENDIELITRDIPKENISSMNMKIGDSLMVEKGDEIMGFGYSIKKENIEYLTGIVSGFDNHNSNNFEDIEDSLDRKPIYIQINTIINEGNQGGPLINTDGEVIGILVSKNKENKCYAIPSRTLLAIYKKLQTTKVLKTPTLSLKWNKTNPDIMELKTGSSKNYGIYVRNIGMDSCLDKLQNGDIIKHLHYLDPFLASKDNLDIVNPPTNPKLVNIICYFDRFGDFISVNKINDDGKREQIVNRKIGFSEIIDMIPIGTNFSMKICRDKEWYEIKTVHEFVETQRIFESYPLLEPYDYEIFSGICFANLDLKHTKYFTNLFNRLHKNSNKYRNQVVILHIFPSTIASKTKVLHPGQIIHKINGKIIRNIKDIRQILKDEKNIISIETENRSLFAIKFDDAVRDDKNIFNLFSIFNHKYIFDTES